MGRTGSVRREQSGTWTCVIDLAPPGARRRQQVRRRGFETEQLANKHLDQLKKSATHITTKSTLGDYLITWLASLPARGLKPSTMASYCQYMRNYVFTDPITEMPLRTLSALDLDLLYTRLRQTGGRHGTGRSPRTVRYLHTIICKALNDAVRKGLLTDNVAKAADPPSAAASRPPEIDVWTPQQTCQFLEHTANDHFFPLYQLAALTGMRRSELVALRWVDVDLDAQLIYVRRAIVIADGKPVLGTVKSRRSRRTIDIDKQTTDVLRNHRHSSPNAGRGYVFTTADDNHWLPDSVSQAFVRAVGRSGLPPISIHVLRHGHATHLLAAGVNPRIVSERLGHASVAFTLDTYGHVMPGQQAEAVEAVVRLMHPTNNET